MMSSGTCVSPKLTTFVGWPESSKSFWLIVAKGRREVLIIALTEGGLAWEVVADATSVIVLSAMDDDSCRPYTVNLAANELSRKLAGHAAGQIVDVQRHWEYFTHFLCFFFLFVSLKMSPFYQDLFLF